MHSITRRVAAIAFVAFSPIVPVRAGAVEAPPPSISVPQLAVPPRVAPSGFGYVPTVDTQPFDATNLTAAFHFLALRNEFYVVYGDPSRLSTLHALYLKWIRYIGAPKGT